ncbi:lipid IV(A) 3-deoxy-D-manno-octulosonic acid transferase [Hydrogenimonas thermophila]|uniref:lipid IV(A) 3-deoxy-D-manno-octulosonic acid transferase n=1 Tax=Hydrogenimonas thermophila TaxID=223786 RepID=UPI00293716C0|nr:lipid IV(A) 3-deoxy-D-manno-octulosonic acid transferase [Hydrogenimonas thermophila]WOE69530.1 lipid IV(A) 3-deoxy-D-manno-octulosonic acid transferase [Hydrogenimonas thermophila]WOE72044.1 lipid IV(A) 3-deoxy-D-manno-octulosonic acid transferase [Hydrogenimonas thermophila]
MSLKKKKQTLNNSIFITLYTIIVLGVYLLFLPLIAIFSFKKKYRQSIPARFFLWKNPPLPTNRIWFHACSFGETRALQPLIDKFSDEQIVLTTTTQTGFNEGKKRFKTVRYLPFEPLLWFWLKPQKALIVMEAELWFLLFYLAKKRGAKTVLINARISDRSYNRYLRFSWFYKKIFSYIDLVYAQSETDKKRLEQLGAKSVEVSGNIKLAQSHKVTRVLDRPDGIVVTAASTHEGEEEGILKAFLKWKKRNQNSKLIIVPRHPERFDKVVKLAQEFALKDKLSLSRWSKTQDLTADIVIIDAMGELINIYAISDIVILGGAFVPVGGHNPVEVVPFKCRLISGTEIFNQHAMFSQIEGTIFSSLDELESALDRAIDASPVKVKQRVSIDVIVKGIQDVV